MGSDRPAVISGKHRATYRVLNELGRGAMGIVYRAEQVDERGHVAREVAIKTIRPDVSGAKLTTLFRREIASAILLRGKHTVTVFEFGETDSGDLFYVMELVRGPTLRQILDQTPILPLDRVGEIGKQVCEALDEAHSLPRPVVHRDLKPGNLLVERWDDRVCVKVSDFGIAKVTGGDGSTRAETAASAGTPKYMAPEQCRGSAVDGRADLYALGVILYEALAGCAPFVGDQMVVMYQHTHQRPPPLPASVPEPVRAVVERLLAKDPDDRPATAEQARQEIERAWRAAGEAFAARRPGSPAGSGEDTRPLTPTDVSAAAAAARRLRRPVAWAAGTAAIAALAAFVALSGDTAVRQTFDTLTQSTAGSLRPIAPPLVAQAESEDGAPKPGAARRTKIAVLAFRNNRDADRDNDWIGKALQASFSTELNKVREIRVVSRDRVDEAAKTAPSASAAARSVGAQKLITGSFAVHRDQIRVDVWLVDATSGVQDMAEMVEGRLDEFFGLQKRIALAMLEHMPVAVGQRERQAIEAENPSENPGAALDAYRLMLQGEGIYEEDPGDAGQEDSPQTRLAPPARGVPPLSRLLDVVSPWPRAASAQEASNAEATIRQVLEAYRQALENGDLDGISKAKGQLSQGRRKGLEQYYQIADDLRVEFDAVEIAPIDEQHFAVSYLRRDEFADRRTGEKVSLEVHLENLAVLDGDQWRLTDKKAD
jgi:TolB-like protein/tRNA A-37 threonylcarbamoyl transferase component Bud32